MAQAGASCLNMMMKIGHAILDLFFPPLCALCKKAGCPNRLCPECWEQCAPVDPRCRCRHCFTGMEQEDSVCAVCQRKPQRLFPSAFLFAAEQPLFWLSREENISSESLAAFVVVQWERLGWPMPDAIVPFHKMDAIADLLSSWLHVPYLPLLRKKKGEWRCEAELIEEGKTLLVLAKSGSEKSLDQAASALYETSPKKVYVLSLAE